MYIVSTGMVSPVGLNAESACAAMRAGISAFEELPYCDNDGEPIMGAVVPGYTLDTRYFGNRLISMLASAVTECLDKLPQLPIEKIPILVGLAEPERPGYPAGLAEEIIDKLQASLGMNFHPEFSQVISSGHTSGFEALGIARELMKNSEIPACLVCGVDSYIRAGSLLWLDQHWRLKTEGNSDGVIPGEAAGAVVVQGLQTNKEKCGAMVSGLAFGHEKAHVLSDEPLLGFGLTEGVRSALAEATLRFHEIDWRFSDLTGEQYGFKEIPLVEARLARVVRKESQPLWHCADSIGDVGSVAGIAQLVAVERAFWRGYAPGNNVICSCSSVFGDRAAVVLEINLRGSDG